MKNYLSRSGAVSSGQTVRCVGILLSVATAVLAVAAWGQGNDWEFSGLSTYQIFPVFGLLAFSLLWSQYMVFGLSRWLHPPKKALGTFFSVSHFFVLLCIVMHPGLLVWQLWRDGFGLPPGSYLQHYVAPGLRWAALLGTISLLMFLAFELRRIFGDRPWWGRIKYVADVAMLAVLYHGFRLGSQLQEGWFRTIWLIYGALLIAVLVYLRGGEVLHKVRKKEKV